MRLPPRSASGTRLRKRGHGAALLFLLVGLSCGGQQQWADLGDFETSQGSVIRSCRLGYRTYGRLDASASNAVLVTPWLLGTSGQVGRDIGPGELVDSARFFVVAVDPLGNGVSSSPSNSNVQPGEAFPRLADFVRSERQLLLALGIQHLRAVVGISMGGMQALAWAATQPDFVDTAVCIVGSPRSTEQDRRHWTNASAAMRSTSTWTRVAGALGQLAPVEALRQLRMHPEDFQLQAEAIRTLDLTTATGGSLAGLAAAIRPRLLVVVSAQDNVVDPAPARELAQRTGAELLVLDGRCGHNAPQCERRQVLPVVQRFLNAGPTASTDGGFPR
jgi:homoserine O-acetyltransferase